MRDELELERLPTFPAERWLEVTTRLSCRVACEYCPQGTFVAAFRHRSRVTELDFGTFERCLARVPRDVRVVFAGFTEPWLNPRCTDMVELAVRSGHPVRVYTTCAGMTPSDVKRLAHLEIEAAYLHLTSSTGNMRIAADEAHLALIEGLIVAWGANATYLHHGAPEAVDSAVLGLLERHGIEPVQWKTHSRAGHVSTLRQSGELGGAIRCMQGREHKNVLLPDGSVTLCCMDWALEHVLGSLLDDDYDALFSGEAYRKLIDDLARGRGARLCRACEWAEPDALEA
jgi:Iron-sulfur cluster-binding domain